MYISQDPIGLAGNNPNFYADVFDSNIQVDVFGLDCNTIEKVRKLVDKVSDENKKIFKCKDFAEELKDLMKKEGIAGEHIQIQLKTRGNLISDTFGTIAEGTKTSGAEHLFIKIDNTVFDNFNTKGIDYDLFKEDLGLKYAPKNVFNETLLDW